MKVLHSLGPCADRQRQYQDAPLGWIWPINVDRVHLASAKEIVCLWLCVCQRVCKFEKYFKEKARACVFVFYSRSLRGYQTSRPCMCVSRCDVRQDTTVFCVVKLMFSVRAPVGELLGLSRKWWGRQLSESSCSECVGVCLAWMWSQCIHFKSLKGHLHCMLATPSYQTLALEARLGSSVTPETKPLGAATPFPLEHLFCGRIKYLGHHKGLVD